MLLIWAEKDNLLPLASLYTHFSESKRWRSKECKTKDFRHSNAAAKALADAPHCSMGLVSEHKLVDIMQFLYHVTPRSAQTLFWVRKCNSYALLRSQQDLPFCPARYREMTFTNVTLMSGISGGLIFGSKSEF